jgi:hypothetical protein
MVGSDQKSNQNLVRLTEEGQVSGVGASALLLAGLYNGLVVPAEIHGRSGSNLAGCDT